MRTLAYCMILLTFLAGVAQADHLGTWEVDDYVTVSVTTHQFSTGAALAATGDVHLTVYEDANDVQLVTDTNMTAFDAVTGLYVARIQLTAALGYEAGKHYTCLIAATVGGVAAITTHNFQVRSLVDPATVQTASTAAQAAQTAAEKIDTASELRTLMTGENKAVAKEETLTDATNGLAALKTLLDTVVTRTKAFWKTGVWKGQP